MQVVLHLEHNYSELRVHLIISVDFSFDQYEVSFLIFFDNFWVNVNFIQYQNGYSNLDLLLGKIFQPFTLRQCLVQSLNTDVCFLNAAKCWVLFMYPICQCMSFYWGNESIHIKRYYGQIIVASCYFCHQRWNYVCVAIFFWVC